jgi:hypothetical protein
MRALLVSAAVSAVIMSGCSGRLADGETLGPSPSRGPAPVRLPAATPPAQGEPPDNPPTTPTPFDAGGAPQAQSCVPGDVPTFAPLWRPPPGPQVGACTSTQVSAALAACFSAGSTGQDCQSWAQAGAEAAACLDCLVGPVTSRAWGPVVYVNDLGGAAFANVGGCVALADPTQTPCGQAIQAAFECEMAACLALCPMPQTASQMTTDALTACFRAADGAGCSSYAAAASACVANTGPASAFCFQAGQDQGALEQALNLSCGQSGGG